MINKEKKSSCFFFPQVFDLVRYAVPYIPRGGCVINVGSIQAYVKIKVFICIKLYVFI